MPTLYFILYHSPCNYVIRPEWTYIGQYNTLNNKIADDRLLEKPLTYIVKPCSYKSYIWLVFMFKKITDINQSCALNKWLLRNIHETKV